MNLNRYTCAAFLFLLMSCASNESKSAVSETKDSTTQETAQQTPEDAPSSDDEIQERGILKKVDDGGYPFATLTIEFPERNFSEYFTINFEDAKGVDLATIYKWEGKHVSFRYTSQITNALLDVQKDGKSLMGENAPEITSEMSKIVGVLQGADEETPGDIPGKVTIGTLSFEFFVTKEMVEANNTKVTGYYEERTQNQVKSIKLLSQ